MRRAFTWLRRAAGRLRVLHRVLVLEFKVTGLLERLAVCEGCGLLLDSQHPKIKLAPRGEAVVPYCRWCYQLAVETGRERRGARHPRAAG